MKSNNNGQHYDAVIIGGGIQGAGCAQALAARGYRVLLLEKSTCGSGTSSRSSKLIHGGLRYLESGQFSLVRKSLAEREILLNIAPRLVQKRKFYLPVYKGQRLNRWLLGAGLFAYCALGLFRPAARFRVVPEKDWQYLSGIRKHNLETVFQYWDAQTDDQQLTHAVIHSARQLGCRALEQASFNQALREHSDDPQKTIYRVQYTHNVERKEVTCQLLVNAAGPWVDQVQSSIEQAPAAPASELIQGSHIELDQALTDGIFYVESPLDQRPVFIMPWQDRTLVGTTEKLHEDAPELCQASEAEIDYLYRTLQHYFPAYQGKIIDSWAGLRVLPSSHTGPAMLARPFSGRARDTFILSDNNKMPSVISLYGGKLTTYRITADDVARLAEKNLGIPSRIVNTAHLPL